MEWASPIITPVLTQNRLVKSLGKLHFRSPCASEALNPFEQKEGRPTKEQNPLPKGSVWLEGYKSERMKNREGLEKYNDRKNLVLFHMYLTGRMKK